MLLELPTADEIDDLAARTPSLTVRRYEFDLVDTDLNLDYTPCKGEVVIVARRGEGVMLVKSKGATIWTLPCARIQMNESPEEAAVRVARERCGLSIDDAQLKAFYDVTRHYRNVSVKRLFVVYSCAIRGDPDDAAKDTDDECSLHSGDLDEILIEEIDSQALSDCL